MAEALFMSIGLEERTAKNISGNQVLAQSLTEIINEAGLQGGCEKTKGALLYLLATRFPPSGPLVKHRAVVAKYVGNGKIRLTAQAEAAFDFCKKTGDKTLDIPAFEKACGAGVEVSQEQIKEAVTTALDSFMADLKERRYHFPAGMALGAIRKKLPFADGALVKEELDRQIEKILGPKTEEDMKPLAKKKKEKPKKADAESGSGDAKGKGAAAASSSSSASAAVPAEEIPEPYFPSPEENTELNTPELLKQHLKRTGKKIVTRFPPEPNGYLHIGHAKAMNLNFGYAKRKNGECNLRFDDTNPAAEKMEFIESIHEDVGWLGHKPTRITYSSDCFDKLYEFAIQLIKEGKAYVCHQTREEMSKSRELRTDSPWRNRPVKESLKIFDDMKKGKIDEGKAVLRLKMDMKSDNPNMRDPVAYRVIFAEHPHAGDKWCVYPSYDYTHCIVDSLEDITHSLCTLEFADRRESYHWLLYALKIYRPVVWEYARLNLTYTVMSKRKLAFLVREGMVDGWDDPRLPTVCGLRRRGFTPSAINTFCEQIGVTRNNTMIPMARLHQCLRLDLDVTASRRFAVLDPLKVIITNFDEEKDVEAPLFPKDPSKGMRTLPWRKVVYIEKNDFRMVDSKDFFRLAPGKTVGLKYAYSITCRNVVTNDAGDPIEIHAEYNKNSNVKCKAYIHWLASPTHSTVVKGSVRLYEDLFTVETPSEEKDWLSVINPNSKRVLTESLFEPSLASAKSGENFQFERVGFFAVDKDSRPNKMVFNRTITLKEAKDMPV